MKVTLIASTIVHPEAAEYLPFKLESNDDGDPYYSSDAAYLTTFAGRSCYKSWSRPNAKTRSDSDYVYSTVVDKLHTSIAEHASASFYIEDISRNISHELVRHRHFSFSQESQRFVDVSSNKFVVPPALRDDEDFEVGEAMMSLTSDYMSLVDYLVQEKGKTRKQAREAARDILPGGLSTSLVMTGNHLAWRQMLVKRLSPTADAGIQELAQEILRQLKELAPELYQDF